jgi:hypothetical protein
MYVDTALSSKRYFLSTFYFKNYTMLRRISISDISDISDKIYLHVSLVVQGPVTDSALISQSHFPLSE